MLVLSLFLVQSARAAITNQLDLDSGGSDVTQLQTYHAVTVSNLQTNTVYYYLVRSVDGTGNMSIIWPSSFRTNQ